MTEKTLQELLPKIIEKLEIEEINKSTISESIKIIKKKAKKKGIHLRALQEVMRRMKMDESTRKEYRVTVEEYETLLNIHK